MQTTTYNSSFAQGWRDELNLKEKMNIGLVLLFCLWLLTASILSLLDPTAGLLDSGILTLLIFGLIVSWLAIYISFWLQELLWRPFKYYRQQFDQHFKRLTPWQQCITYFGVFFLLLYAVIQVTALVFT